MVTELPKTANELRNKVMTQRPAAQANAEEKKVAELRFITDALLLLLERWDQKP